MPELSRSDGGRGGYVLIVEPEGDRSRGRAAAPAATPDPHGDVRGGIGTENGPALAKYAGLGAAADGTRRR